MKRSKNNKILYLDDQKDNLIVLQAHLADDWDMSIHTNSDEALKVLPDYNPAIVLSDMRMPSMNGVEFLSKVREVAPNAVRVVITGYSDEHLIVGAIRMAQVFDYIIKPYDPNEIKDRLNAAAMNYEAILKLEKERDSAEKLCKSLTSENAKLKSELALRDKEIEALKQGTSNNVININGYPRLKKVG